MKGDSAVIVRIFAGFPITAEWKFFLQASVLFQHAKLDQDIQTVRFEGKDYLGVYIKENTTFQEIKILEKQAREKLQSFCPTQRVDKLQFILFPHLLIC